MGRLIGVPYFLSPQAHDDEKVDAAKLRKAKKEALESTQVNPSLQIQRTTQSDNWQGKNLLELSPIKRIKAIINTGCEMSIINKLEKSAKEK